MKIFVVLCGFLSLNVLSASAEFTLSVTSDSPIATGTFVTFNVTLLEDGKIAPNKKYQFSYDFAGGSKSVETGNSSYQFILQADRLDHGRYRVEFLVEEWYIFVYVNKARATAYFEVTNRFMGDMELIQDPNNTVRDNGFVSSQFETVHNVIISDKDKKLYEKAAYTRVFWFIDCLYMGVTDTLNFTNWYRQENQVYNIEALLELSYEPLPIPTSSTTTTTSSTTTTTTPSTTTTSTTTTTTTPRTTTTSSTTTTTPSTTTSTSTTTKKPNLRRRRDAPNFEWNVKKLVETGSIRPENIADENILEKMVVTTEIPMDQRRKLLEEGSDMVPYFGVCTNNTKVITDPKKIYGYYQRTIKVQNPVQNVTVSDNVWLKHGDMCHISIKFHGTAPFYYCLKPVPANNNSVTSVKEANDKCDSSDWRVTSETNLKYTHFFPKSSNSYTVFFYLQNNVSDTTVPIGVQFYEAQSHSQLSVIIIPVIFSLVAVVVIVFGVAYYVQNRNQFLIETADFNFGDTQSIDSMEYKSFLQRLLDSVSDLFIRNDYLNNEEPDSPGPSFGESNVRYGNMN